MDTNTPKAKVKTGAGRMPEERRAAVITSAVELIRELIDRNIDEAVADACDDFKRADSESDEAPAEPTAKLTVKLAFHPLKDGDELKCAVTWTVKRGETATCDVPTKQEKFEFAKAEAAQ